MTTFIPFSPVGLGTPFLFSVTLDGLPYTIAVTWNLYRQGFYISVRDQNNTLVLTRPMTASPPALPLAAPAQLEAVTSITWSADNGGQLTFVMPENSSFVLGDLIEVTGATNSGTGGDSIINTRFTINTWTDPRNFTALLNAPSGVVGTIGGIPQLILETYALTWSNATGSGVVTASAATRHQLALGEQVSLVISGAAPDPYNGRHLCLPTSPWEFTFPLSADPGHNSIPGNYGSDINLVDGYFSSELVFRPSLGRFEVTP